MDIGSGGGRPKGQHPPGSLPEARPTLRPDNALQGKLGPFHQFFATTAVACPYVPGRAERKLIVELTGRTAAAFYDELSRAGFRRSHRFAYRPACRQCAACVPVRIAVEGVVDTRSAPRGRNHY